MHSFLVLLKNKHTNSLSHSLLHAHVAHLQALNAEGHLVFCGPFSDNQGACLLLRAESEIVAKQLVERDPFISENYYRSYEMHQVIQATEENNWLLDNPQTQSNLNEV